MDYFKRTRYVEALLFTIDLGFVVGSLGFEPRIARAPGVNLRPSSTTTPTDWTTVFKR
jgi:hypothetical protein